MGFFVVIPVRGGVPVAYVEGRRCIVEPTMAVLLERCLLVYGLRVNMGVEDTVSEGRRSLSGFALEAPGDVSTGEIVKALEVCIGFAIGARATVERTESFYEAKPRQVTTQEEGVGGVELEEA
ncbi:MAG: hypothetical protein QXM08_05350 [Thermofilaceae archaeon]